MEAMTWWQTEVNGDADDTSRCTSALWIDTARLRIVLAARWRAAQSCRLPCQQKGASRQWQGNRHHCLSVCNGLGCQSVGKAEYRHAKALGYGSLRLVLAKLWLAA